MVSDDATSEVYYAQLVEETSTLTVMAALKHVVETKGVFCTTIPIAAATSGRPRRPAAKVDPQQLAQVGRAWRELGIQMIPAYSPQARGRCERAFATRQGRLPQEQRLHRIDPFAQANEDLREVYVAAFNGRFQVAAAQRGKAFTHARASTWTISSPSRPSAWSGATTPASSSTWSYRSSRSSGAEHSPGPPSPCTDTSNRTISLTLGPLRLGNYLAGGIRIEAVKLDPKPNHAVEKMRDG